MNSFELTDIDGDALTLINRDEDTWITCTSGPEEVTVGPFPSRLVRRAFAPVIDAPESVTTLLGRSSTPRPAAAPRRSAPTPTTEQPPVGRSAAASDAATPTGPGTDARDRAWAAFLSLAETATLREALDAALDAALAEEGRERPSRGQQG